MVGTAKIVDDADIYLSYLLKEFSFDREELLKLLTKHGLDKFLPRKRTPGEVFETVTSRLNKVYFHNGLRYEANVKQASNKGNAEIERVVLVTEIDRNGRKVSDGKKTVRLIFDKDNQTFSYMTSNHCPYLFEEELVGDLAPIPDFVADDVASIPANMDKEKLMVSPGQIRNMLAQIVSSVGIPVQGAQAAWTIPSHERQVAVAVKELADDINEAQDSIVIQVQRHSIVNDDWFKEQISGDAAVFVAKEFNTFLMKEQEKIEMADDPVKESEKAQERFRKKAAEVLAVIDKHENILDTTKSNIQQARIEVENDIKIFGIDVVKKAS